MIQVMKEQLQKLVKQTKDETLNAEESLEKNQQDLQIMEGKFFNLLQIEQQNRRESEGKILRILDVKYNSLKNELSKETKQRCDSLDQIGATIETELPHLQ